MAARLPDVEARWLVEEVSGVDRSRWREAAATPEGRARLRALLERRLAGEPLQYVLGRWSFRGLDLRVDPRVLIPRPETEVVAEVAIAESAVIGGPFVVADLGTGSGALALALAAELRAWPRVCGTKRCPQA